MQLCVFSDTHNHDQAVRDVMLSHKTSDYFVFCGDGENEVDRFLEERPEFAPRMIRVRGNNDYGSLLPLTENVPLPYGHRMLVLHGHRHFAGDYTRNLVALAKQNHADIVVFGHLHARIDRWEAGILLFNPGSAAQPRDGKPASFGLIDVMESGILTSHGDMPRSSYGMRQW